MYFDSRKVLGIIHRAEEIYVMKLHKITYTAYHNSAINFPINAMTLLKSVCHVWLKHTYKPLLRNVFFPKMENKTKRMQKNSILYSIKLHIIKLEKYIVFKERMEVFHHTVPTANI